MARFRARTFGVNSRGPRRETSWEDGPGGTVRTNLTAIGPSIIGAGSQVTVDGLTLVRTRGRFVIKMATAAAALDAAVGAFGICVVEQNAFAIGVTAVPTPITDADWDGWIDWTPVSLETAAVISGTSDSGAGVILDYVVDSKSMRRLKLGDAVIGVFEWTVETGTVQLSVYLDSRILVKLS